MIGLSTQQTQHCSSMTSECTKFNVIFIFYFHSVRQDTFLYPLSFQLQHRIASNTSHFQSKNVFFNSSYNHSHQVNYFHCKIKYEVREINF